MSETENPHFDAWYTIRVTGKIFSEKGHPSVKGLLVMVATTYPEDHPDHDDFKCWPMDSKDPQLPPDHDGKLWFSREEAQVVEVVSDPNGDPV